MLVGVDVKKKKKKKLATKNVTETSCNKLSTIQNLGTHHRVRTFVSGLARHQTAVAVAVAAAVVVVAVVE